MVATHPIQFIGRRGFQGPRRCASPGLRAVRQAAPQAFHRAAVFQDPGRDGGAVRRPPEALENSVEIARRCSLTCRLGKTSCRCFRPEGMTSTTSWSEARTGLEAPRRAPTRPEARPSASGRERPPQGSRPTPSSRWAFRLLPIVADFINWAKNNGVPVGPGGFRRGLAGRLFSLRASPTFDPLAYALLFERFLNPSGCRCPTSTSTSARTTATA